jgi:hypothetical protein
MQPLTSLWEVVLCCALVLESHASAQEPTPQRAPQQERQQQRQPAARPKGQTAAPKLLLERVADAPLMLLGGRRTAAQDAVAAGSSKGKRGGKAAGSGACLTCLCCCLWWLPAPQGCRCSSDASSGNLHLHGIPCNHCSGARRCQQTCILTLLTNCVQLAMRTSVDMQV